MSKRALLFGTSHIIKEITVGEKKFPTLVAIRSSEKKLQTSPKFEKDWASFGFDEAYENLKKLRPVTVGRESLKVADEVSSIEDKLKTEPLLGYEAIFLSAYYENEIEKYTTRTASFRGSKSQDAEESRVGEEKTSVILSALSKPSAKTEDRVETKSASPELKSAKHIQSFKDKLSGFTL